MAKDFSQFDEVAKEHGQGGSADGWFRFQDGENKIRIVSGFEPLGKHFDAKTKKSTVCVGKDKGCVFHEGDTRTPVKYLTWIIDRADGEIKIAELPYTVIKALSELRVTDEYTFEGTPPYDITVKKKGEGLETEYAVMPARKNTELTNEEKEAIGNKKDISDIVEAMKEKAMPNAKAEKKIPPKIEYDESEIKPEDIPY